MPFSGMSGDDDDNISSPKSIEDNFFEYIHSQRTTFTKPEEPLDLES